MNYTLAALIAAITATYAINTLDLPAIAGAVCPVAREMIAHQEDNVTAMEELGFTGAAKARAQWEPRKATALARIQAMEEATQTTTEQ